MSKITKMRKATDTKEMLEMLKNKHGDILVKVCVPINQGKDSDLFSMSMSVLEINAFIMRLPRDYENPDGIERVLKMKNVEDIKIGQSKSKRYDTPNSISIMLDKTKNGEYYTLAELSKDPCIYTVKIDLAKILSMYEGIDIDKEGYVKDPEKVSIGWMIDGHHRTEGAFLSAIDGHPEKYDYEFATSCYIGRDKSELAKFFSGINSNQEKPSTTHTTAMKILGDELSDEEKLSVVLMEKLNDSEDSVLYNRIKTVDGPIPKTELQKYINNAKALSLLKYWWERFKESDLNSNLNTQTEKYNFLNDYLSAYSEVFSEAWSSKKHVLTKSMGFDIMFHACVKITVFTMKLNNLTDTMPTKENFEDALKKVFFKTEDSTTSPVTIELDDGTIVPFDWSSEIYGKLSSGKGINSLNKKVLELIDNAKK